MGQTCPDLGSHTTHSQAACVPCTGTPVPGNASSWDVGAYISDTVVLPPRSWAVVRLLPSEWSSGIWMMHCHTQHYMLRGMTILLDVLPDQRPPLPDWLYSSLGGYGGGADDAAAAGAPGTARCGWGCSDSVLANVGHVGYSQAVKGTQQGLPQAPPHHRGLTMRATLALALTLGISLLIMILVSIALRVCTLVERGWRRAQRTPASAAPGKGPSDPEAAQLGKAASEGTSEPSLRRWNDGTPTAAPAGPGRSLA
jgi:hypothetical protein